MAENTVNQRLKILIDALGLSVNAFGDAIGVPGTTTRNYLVRGTNPKSDFLAKVARHFEQVSPIWLFTGEGDMFLPTAPGFPGTIVSATTYQSPKKNKGQVVGIGTNHGAISYSIEDCKKERDDYKAERDRYKLQAELLASQLADKERTIQILLKQNT